MSRRHHPIHNPHPLLRLAFLLAGVIFVFAGVVFLWIAVTPTPDLSAFENRKISESTKIYDRTGKTVLYDLDRDSKRDSVPLSEISPQIRNATIAIEDASFYTHGGISIRGIIRSILKDILIVLQLSDGYTQGGSTITQQVLKNTILTGKKTPVRKVHEMILAIKLEHRYSKDEILEFYLNETPYGGPYYGVETASVAFFGKSAKEVTTAEAAYLAALPQAPTYFSPYGNNRAALDNRKNVVLNRMLELGYITESEHASAKAEEVKFSPQRSSSIIAPHFVFFIEQYLEEKYGTGVVGRGFKVVTTLDTDIQHIAETTVAEYAAANLSKFNATNAALIALDPKTGQILSMVGSKDYFDPTIDGNYNASLALRQPGSAFKPFVYAAALAKGFTPQTVIFDLPTQFSTSCSPADNYNKVSPCYAPSNYDDKFRGPMTFTTALAQSINVPAVKVLYLAGIQNVINLATAAGMTTLDTPSHYGLTLALGAAEVRLLDLVAGYATFANQGVYNPPVGILSVTDSSGNVLEEFTSRQSQVLDAGVANDLSNMLSDNSARIPSYAPNNPLTFAAYDVAAKTGTTNDYKDTWTVGYTPSIALGVWAGNNDATPMVKETAGYIVAPMWHSVMEQILPKYPQEYFGEGRTMSEDAPPALFGNYSGRDGIHDILHWVSKENPLAGQPRNPANDPQYVRWEYAVQAWAAINGGQ